MTLGQHRDTRALGTWTMKMGEPSTLRDELGKVLLGGSRKK